MSTKIYDGLIFKTNNLNRFNIILNKINSELKLLTEELSYNLAIKKFVKYYDDKCTMVKICNDIYNLDEHHIGLLNSKDNDLPLIYKIEYILNELAYKVRNQDSRMPEYDFDVSCYFYFLKNCVLVIPTYEYKEYLTVFKKYLEDFCYFNNSDKPNNISDEEWEHRRIMWDKALDTTPLKFNLYDKYDNIFNDKLNLEKLLTYLPSKEKRAERMAKLFCINNLMMASTSNKTSTSLYFEALDNFEKKENQIIYQEEKQKILCSLDEITIDILKNYKI